MGDPHLDPDAWRIAFAAWGATVVMLVVAGIAAWRAWRRRR